MLNKLLIFLLVTAFLSCQENCNLDLQVGEILRIPIEFKNFSEYEIAAMRVYRIDKDSSSKLDTFQLINYVFTCDIKNKKISLTDKDVRDKYGYYGSYFNDCDLVFDWIEGTDTFKNIEVLKSKRVVEDKCYKDHPNVRIDHFSFFHKGSIVGKDETVIIEK